MKNKSVFYIAMIIFLISCKGKETPKEVNWSDSIALNSDWYVPDTIYGRRSIGSETSITIDTTPSVGGGYNGKLGEIDTFPPIFLHGDSLWTKEDTTGFNIEMSGYYDVTIEDSTGTIAFRRDGKWTVIHCERALEEWFKCDSLRVSRRMDVIYDTIVLSNGTPIQFANNKN